MKDRQPTQVLSNGAIRYGVYNADGTLNHYEYLKREDAPTVEGTLLNKANLLSDATAAKLWPNATTRPEDPTVNDALGKLSEGTAIVGDIAITARTDLSNAWLPCDGRTVSQEQYPSLCAVLRTPDSPAIWTEKTVSTNVGAGGDAISYENGHWFRTYQDTTSAHILVSDDGETWTEWAMPQNFWANSPILSSRIVAAHAVKYFGGLYVCSVCVLCAKSSGVAYYQGIIFASEIFGQFQVDAPSVWYPDYSSIIKEFAAKSEYDVFWDGQRFLVLGTYRDLEIIPTIRYTNQLTNRSSPVEEDSQAWKQGDMTNFNPIGMYVRKSDGMIVCLGWGTGAGGYPGNYLTYVIYAKTAASNFTKKEIYAWTADLNDDFSDFVETDEGIYVTCNNTYDVIKITGDSKLTTTIVTKGNPFDHATNCNGQLVAVRGSTVNVTEDIEQGWDYTTTLSAEGKQPVAVGTIVRIPLSSNGATVKDVLHNFAYDNKKIPAITTDTRSKAYIKALEE